VIGYPLAALLVVRAREEVAARLALARSTAAEDRCRAERDAAARRAAVHRARLVAQLGPPGRERPVAGELRERAAFAERLGREAAALDAVWRDAEGALRYAEGDAERSRAALSAARTAVRALERHRERWSAEVGRLRARREEAAADDLVSARRAAP
jgi:YscO-like protein